MDCCGMEMMDFCSEPECLDSVITTDRTWLGLKAPHTPTHDMLRVHSILFDRDAAEAGEKAKEALQVARGAISDLEDEKKPMPGCFSCQNVVLLPCWCCVDCTGELSQNSLEISRYSSDPLRRGEIHLC